MPVLAYGHAQTRVSSQSHVLTCIERMFLFLIFCEANGTLGSKPAKFSPDRLAVAAWLRIKGTQRDVYLIVP